MTYPFVAFMILSFYPDLDETQLGYYSGVLEGSFHVGQLFGALIWGSLSDVIGRRPVLLSGLLWTAVSCTVFGLSTSYGMAIWCVRSWLPLLYSACERFLARPADACPALALNPTPTRLAHPTLPTSQRPLCMGPSERERSGGQGSAVRDGG
jgi:MFS family permease